MLANFSISVYLWLVLHRHRQVTATGKLFEIHGKALFTHEQHFQVIEVSGKLPSFLKHGY